MKIKELEDIVLRVMILVLFGCGTVLGMMGVYLLWINLPK